MSIGFYTFSGGGPVTIATSATPPAPVPGSGNPNNVLAMTGDTGSFAGFIHGFENAAVDTWVPQDWSAFAGLRLWVYGQNTGTALFLDVLDNRNPGSSSDDAERWTVNFTDDFSGWQLFEFPFSSLVRKEVGNGAPNDGFTLIEVHGWALGMLTTPGEITFHVDDAVLYGAAEIPDLTVNFSAGGYDIEEGTTGTITVELNRPMTSNDPAQVSVDYFSEPGVATPLRDYIPVYGTLNFVNGGPSELTFELTTIDNNKWEGNKPIPLKLANLVDVATGTARTSSAFIIENDAYDANLLDDFERDAYPYLWGSSADTMLSNLNLMQNDALARPGQDTIKGVLKVHSPLAVEVILPGNSCKGSKGVIPISLLTTATLDALSVDHTSVTLGNASEARVDKKTGLARRHVEDVDKDGDMDLVFHFRAGHLTAQG